MHFEVMNVFLQMEFLSYLEVEVAQLLKAVELVRTPFLNVVYFVVVSSASNMLKKFRDDMPVEMAICLNI